MTNHGSDFETRVLRAVRGYRVTSIYLCVMTTIIAIIFVSERF